MTGDPHSASTLLLVEDDEVFRTRLAQALRGRGMLVTCVADGESALETARQTSPQLALVDLRLPGMGGLDVLRGLLAIDGSTKVIVLTGHGNLATALEALRLGATHYLIKPAAVDEILVAFAGQGAAGQDS